MPPIQIPAQLEPTVAPERPSLVPQTQRPTEGTFGGYAAKALERVGAKIEKAGDTGADIAIAFQRQQNETDVDAANVKYDNTRRQMLFGEGGFYTKKGKDAYDARVPTEMAIEDLRNETRKALSNPEQQRMFDIMSRRGTQMDLRSMSMHAAQENHAYRVGVSEASIKNAQDDAAAYWNDPNRFARALGDITVHAENRARMLGHTDPEQIKAEVGHYTSQAWVGRIKQAMGENPILAKALFEANKDQVTDAKDKIAIEHELKVVAMPEEAKQLARLVIEGRAAPAEGTVRVGGQGEPGTTQEGGAPTTPRDTKAQLASWLPTAEREAERLYPGNQTFKDLVVAQVKGHVNTIAAMQDALSRQAHSTVMAAANQKRPDGTKAMTVDELLGTPDTRRAWALLSPEAQHGFVSANGVLAQNAKEARGELVRSNPKLVNNLASRMYLPEGDPQRISSPTQLTEYRGKGLNHTDYESLRKELAEANTPEGNPFLKQVNGVKQTARRMLLGSNRGILHPDAAEEAAHRFGEDLDRKLAEARKAGRDTQELFNSSAKDYVLDLNRVGSFMPTEADIRAGKRPKPPAPAGGAAKRLPGETPQQFLDRVGKSS